MSAFLNFKETNRLRILRRFLAGYACLIVGLIGLAEMFAEQFLGWGKSAPFHMTHLIVSSLLVVTGMGNVFATKAPK